VGLFGFSLVLRVVLGFFCGFIGLSFVYSVYLEALCAFFYI
jgi:hypothetical protein